MVEVHTTALNVKRGKMRIVETKNLIFEDYTDMPYLDEIVSYVSKHEQEILNFFRIPEFNPKWKVQFIPFEEFKNTMIQLRGKYEDYEAGLTQQSIKTIKSLNIEDQIKYTKHKDCDINRIRKMIVHEFVHASYSVLLPNSIQWFNEALATYLSHQDRELKDISDVDLTGLKIFNDIAPKGGYTYAYYIARYLFANYSEDEIYKLVSDRDYLIEKQNGIFEETKEWIKKQVNNNTKK